MWFIFGCFTAGTPQESQYFPLFQALQERNELNGPLDILLEGLTGKDKPPFIAALPKAALASPSGPLAVMGHVDHAWTYSYQDPSHATHPSRFYTVIRTLLRHYRAGVAAGALARIAGSAQKDLAMYLAQVEIAKKQLDPFQHGLLWMTSTELSNYVLLGDPAVRLPGPQVA